MLTTPNCASFLGPRSRLPHTPAVTPNSHYVGEKLRGDSIYTGSTDNTSSSNLDANHVCWSRPLRRTRPRSSRRPGSPWSLELRLRHRARHRQRGRGRPDGQRELLRRPHEHRGHVHPGPLPRLGHSRRRRRGSPTGAGASSAASSKDFVPNSVGTWCFSAVYGGSATYAASADYASSATEDTGQCLLVNPPIGDAITSAPTASARAGFPFSFLVTTSGSPTPTIKRTGKASGATTSSSRHCSARGKRATP